MSTLQPGTVLEKVWTVSHELPESAETVVFDANRSELLVLNATAGALWYVLDGRRDLVSAVAFLRESLPEPPTVELMLSELVPFVETMLERGALRIVGLVSLDLRVAGLDVRVRSEAPALLAALEVLWAPARRAVEAPDLEFDVAADGSLRCQGALLVEGGGALERIPDVSGVIIEEVTERNLDAVLLHAAGVLLGERLLVFVGESCAGKSSFTREALRAGASYVADDFLVLRGRDLTGIGRAVQFDFCEEDEVPSYFRDCRLVPFPASVAGGVSPVVPVWNRDYAAVDGLHVPDSGTVVIQLCHAEGEESEQLVPLDALQRLAAIHAASLTVARDYDGGLGYGPSFELRWREPGSAFALLRAQLAVTK